METATRTGKEVATLEAPADRPERIGTATGTPADHPGKTETSADHRGRKGTCEDPRGRTETGTPAVLLPGKTGMAGPEEEVPGDAEVERGTWGGRWIPGRRGAEEGEGGANARVRGIGDSEEIETGIGTGGSEATGIEIEGSEETGTETEGSAETGIEVSVEIETGTGVSEATAVHHQG